MHTAQGWEVSCSYQHSAGRCSGLLESLLLLVGVMYILFIQNIQNSLVYAVGFIFPFDSDIILDGRNILNSDKL